MFALAGGSNEYYGNKFPSDGFWDVEPVFGKLPQSKVSWRSYSHDMAFLRMVNGYKLSQNIYKIRDFYKRARDKRLPKLSWIDPNFRVVPNIIEESKQLIEWTSDLFEGIFGEEDSIDVDLETDNSDHPDADNAEGQKLIARVYNALLKNDPTLANTLFIITYDELGGFYDHVIPPGWPDSDSEMTLEDASAQLGVRVPSLAISGRLQGGNVCHTELDHSTIVRTILEKYHPDEIKTAPARVQSIPSLWEALNWSEEVPEKAFNPLRKPRPRQNGLRQEMGGLAKDMLEQGTPIERL